MKKVYFVGYGGDTIPRNVIKFPDTVLTQRVDRIEESDVIVVNDCISADDMELIRNYRGRRVAHATEPFSNDAWLRFSWYPFRFRQEIYAHEKFDAYVGSRTNKDNHYKAPHYIVVRDFYREDIFRITNNYVKACDLSSKKFASLINNHDAVGTRTPLFRMMSTLGHVDCPGKLFNNNTNEELNKVGKVEYLKQFLFNVCPENCKPTIDGYVTEKIAEPCFAGAIPVYFGWFDETDAKIFNRDRIIFVNPYDKESIAKTSEFIESLINDKDKLEKFYRQDVFCADTAWDTILEFRSNIEKAVFGEL